MGLIAQHALSSFTSPVNGTTPIDANVVRGNDNTIKVAYNAHDADATIHMQSAAVASRPAFGNTGASFMATDAGAVYIYSDTGSAWVEVNYVRNTGGTVSGQVTIVSTTTPQLTVEYDGSHTATFSVSSGGALTLNATSTVTITPATTITGALTQTGLATFNGGATVASGQTLTVSGVTVTGLTAASVGAGTFAAGAFVFPSTVTIGAAANPVQVGRLSDGTSYGAISFNGSLTTTGIMGIFGRIGTTEGVYFNTPTSTVFQFTTNGVNDVKFNAGAVSGVTTLSASGSTTIGVGGSGSTQADLILSGSSNAGFGPLVRLRRNGVEKGFIGTESGVIGNNSDDVALYSKANVKFYTNDNSATAAITASSTTLTVALATTAVQALTATGATIGTATGNTLAAGSLDLHADIGMNTTQGIIIGSTRVVAFSSGATSITTTGGITVGAGGTGTTEIDLTVNSGSGSGGSAILILQRNSANRALYGVSGGAGALIVGSVANELAIRNNGNIIFSTDDGATIGARLNAGALTLAAGISATTASFSSALTYGGVTLSNAVTGTGNMVLATAPTVSTLTVSSGGVTITSGGLLVSSGGTQLNAALTYGGVTLSNAVTGTGNMVLSASPTFTGTVTAAALSATTGTFSTSAKTGSGSTLVNTGAGAVTLFTTAGAGMYLVSSYDSANDIIGMWVASDTGGTGIVANPLVVNASGGFVATGAGHAFQVTNTSGTNRTLTWQYLRIN